MGEIWNDIYQFIIEKNYSKIELKEIIREWNFILGRNILLDMNEDEYIWYINNQIRMLKDKNEREGEIILIKSLQVLECPGKCSLKDLNQLLRKNHISYKYNNRLFDNIFISHSEKDKEYAKAFVELLEDMHVPKKRIFCTSLADYGIPLNKDIYEAIKEQFTHNNIYVIFLLSENYYKSAACLNEMGATWVLQKDYTTILLPGYEYTEIRGAINAGGIGIKLDEDTDNLKHRLYQLKNKLEEDFDLQSEEDHIWERRIRVFLKHIDECTNKIL